MKVETTDLISIAPNKFCISLRRLGQMMCTNRSIKLVRLPIGFCPYLFYPFLNRGFRYRFRIPYLLPRFLRTTLYYLTSRIIPLVKFASNCLGYFSKLNRIKCSLSLSIHCQNVYSTKSLRSFTIFDGILETLY